ncbi:MAG: copper transporter [Streptosporangiaceae bacterium]
MIDFRYHLVSIVAVFLALAIGIVLGSTELQGPTYNLLDRTTAKLQAELNQVSGQRNTAQAQASVGEAYAQAVEPVVLRNLLAGQRLLIVTEPGAQASVVAGITDAATADAGATVTGQIALQNKFFDTSDTTLDFLNQTNQAMAQAAGIQLNTGETYQQQAAEVMAKEILVKSAGSTPDQPGIIQPTGGVPDSTAQTMLGAYANSGFLTTSGQPYLPATLVIVVTPQTAPSDGTADALDSVLIPLATELSTYSAATVVVGTSAGSGPGSPIAVLRANSVANQVSTVDDTDLVSGQTVAIESLATLLSGGKAGSYGLTANGATAVAPSPAPSPSASTSPSASVSPTPTTKAKK